MGIALDLQFTLKRIAILPVLSLSGYKHGKSFHLFKSLLSVKMFHNVLVYKTCTSFGKFIRKYFILFDAIVRNCFLNCFFVGHLFS